MSFPKIKNIEHEIYKNLFFNVFNNKAGTKYMIVNQIHEIKFPRNILFSSIREIKFPRN